MRNKPTPSLAHFAWLLHPLKGATPAARQSRFRGVPRLGCASACACHLESNSVEI